MVSSPGDSSHHRLKEETIIDDGQRLDAALYVVATPIGNLKDITLRALEVLKKADWIAAEDTRQTKQLLQHYGIRGKLLSVHGHNEKQQLGSLSQKISDGESIALVTDAGTPAISDPGAFVVNHIRSQHQRVIPIPGPSAVITAMSVAGLMMPQFFFYGFLPHQPAARRTQLNQWQSIEYPVICYESPHRLTETLKDCEVCLGPTRRLVLGKELTKIYEHVIEGNAATLLEWLDENRKRGEFVLIIAPAEKSLTKTLSKKDQQIVKMLLKALPLKSAVKIAAEITGERKNLLYSYALEIQQTAPTD